MSDIHIRDKQETKGGAHLKHFNVPGVNSESASLVFCLGALNHTALHIPL